jgi:hypothetical protein
MLLSLSFHAPSQFESAENPRRTGASTDLHSKIASKCRSLVLFEDKKSLIFVRIERDDAHTIHCANA